MAAVDDRTSVLITCPSKVKRVQGNTVSFTKLDYKMERTYTEEITFEKKDFSENPLEKGDYENCTFINCDFSNSDLSHISFVECQFTGSNLSMVTLIKTVFKDIKFKDCKLLGLSFDNCSDFLFSVDF